MSDETGMVRPSEPLGAFSDDPPDDYEDCGLEMTNFDHSIDDGFAEKLQSGKFYGQHCAWDHHGIVWWDGQQFVERVKVYQVVQGTYRALTLRELMEKVNELYGDG